MAVITEEYRREPVDARLAFAGSGVQVLPDAPGRDINAGATLAALQKKYRIGHDSVPVTTRVLNPRVAAADLQGREVVLGRFSTYFDRGLRGRTRNIRIAAAAIDGRVLMPGDKFSFNESTGERTWGKGYRMAHIFENRGNGSEVVDGLAGGVCQVSTTVYNAVRKTNRALPSGVNLRINERNYHSLPVTYVPRGMDATVAWPHKDFRFSNTLTHPVFLRAVVDGSNLRVSIHGYIPHSTPAPYATRTTQVPSEDSNS
jgi:vancomycin resistance protein YoaR